MKNSETIDKCHPLLNLKKIQFTIFSLKIIENSRFLTMFKDFFLKNGKLDFQFFAYLKKIQL